jgi:hypothetical protein
MKKLFLILLLSFISFHVCAQPQQLHFRTDGYYYYNNDCDTIFLTQMDAKKKAEMIDFLRLHGITVGKVACIPEGQMAIIGGSEAEVFAFLAETGTYDDFGSNCWTSAVYTDMLQSKKKKQADFAKGETDRKKLKYLMLKPDNRFENYAGTIKISGTLYRDSLVLTETYPEYMGFKIRNDSRVYRFYPFSQSPPTRDRFIYVYKDPLQE